MQLKERSQHVRMAFAIMQRSGRSRAIRVDRYCRAVRRLSSRQAIARVVDRAHRRDFRRSQRGATGWVFIPSGEFLGGGIYFSPFAFVSFHLTFKIPYHNADAKIATITVTI